MKFSIPVIICVIVTSSVSTAIPYWVTLDVTSQDKTIHEHAGLWKVCSEGTSGSSCLSFTDVKGYVDTTRGLMITGILLFGISILFAGDSSTKSANTCIIILALGGVLLIVAMFIFGQNYDAHDMPNASYGSAFYLPIPSAIFAFIAAVCVNKAKRDHGYVPIGRTIIQT